MNKKIFVGLMALSIAATFWACGSGDIIKADDDDRTMGMQVEENPTMGISPDVMTPETCPKCFEGGEPSKPVPSSSSVTTSSSSSLFTPPVPQSSSSSSEIIINTNSSSSRPPYVPTSSSAGPVIVSSSTEIIVDGPGGSCVPAQAIVEQGEPVIWKYSIGGNVKTTDVLKATFTWSTPGALPETVSKNGATGMNDTVSYATSGTHTASLALSTAKGSFNIQCSPVQVNGSPISGCLCATESKSVDFTANPEVSWSVSGCKTGAGLELSYEWDGVPGLATYTKSFTAAHAGYVPKLIVKNNDNTMIEVKNCPAVKITDGPEFEITTTQGAGAIKLPKGTSSVVLSVDAYNNTVFCNVSRDDSPSGSLNGTVNKVALKGADYITATMPAGTLVKGATLEFTLDVAATCGVQ